MDNTQLTVPANYDPDFIRTQAGLTAWSYPTDAERASGETYIFRTVDGEFDRLADAVAAYETAYAPVMASVMLRQASSVRDQKIGSFEFGSFVIPLDSDTRANLTGAALGLMRNEDIEAIEWSLGDGEFVTLDRASILLMADMAFRHVQHCFAAHKAIASEIKAATTVTQLTAIEVADHPAWNS